MGCFPNTTLGNKNDISKQITPLTFEVAISSALFVKEESGDPFLIYNILNPLGEGSFGKVYKVKHKKTGMIRAMKAINKKKQNLSKDKEKELIKEINILKKLDHPNIIKVYEYFNLEKVLFIITELCTGGELFSKIVQVKHFSEEVAAHIMRQLLSAVRFCHLNNVIHRDLKPENILIETENERRKDFFSIKVIDFGTSEYKRRKKLTELIGTSYYIAPEVLNNNYNEKCDLWSCGVILYILLSGRPPFYGKTDEEIFERIKLGKFNINCFSESISLQAKDLINNLLTVNSEKRLNAQEALDHPWFILHEKNKVINCISLETVNNLLNFHASRKFQHAVLTFIVHNLAKREDIIEQRNTFLALDHNRDGRLTKDEIIVALQQIMTLDEANYEIDKIMSNLDQDQNGFIEYEEFLRASYNMQKLLTEENLFQAFCLFDKDHNGQISYQELKNILSEHNVFKNDNIWKEMISEFDLDGNGEINFFEFKEMMNIMLENTSKKKDKMIVDDV
jgi:calcium-dependent protein kinase